MKLLSEKKCFWCNEIFEKLFAEKNGKMLCKKCYYLISRYF